MRTCIGCRTRCEKPALLRVVGAGTRVVPDPTAVLTGRGAYLHRRLGCFDLAVRRRAFGRALRLSGELDLDEVRAALEQEVAAAESPEGAQDEHPMNGQP